MMKYKYVIDETSDIYEQEYKIVETDTDNVIYHRLPYRDAQRQCKFLNRGAGFFGFTPNFFLRSAS